MSLPVDRGHRAGDSQWVAADVIASIETFPLRIPFQPGERPPAAGPAVDSLLVRVSTAHG